MSTQPKSIPRSILAPLAKTAWAHDNYSLGKFHDLLAHPAPLGKKSPGLPGKMSPVG